MAEIQTDSTALPSAPALDQTPQRLLAEIISLAVVLCTSLIVVALERRGVVGGGGYLSSGVLLVLSLWHLRRFRPAIPLLPNAHPVMPATVFITAALLLLIVFRITGFLSGFDSRLRMAQVLHLVVLVPLTEELYFRGLLLDHLQRAWGGWRAALLCSALFGLLHLHAGSIVGATILSLIGCYLVLRRGSVGFAIQLHVAWNAIAQMNHADDASQRMCAVVAFVSIVGIAIAILIGSRYARRRQQPSMPPA